MPRVKLAGYAYKDNDLSRLLRRYKYGANMTNVEVAEKIGICERTFASYLDRPDAIPLKVLRKIQKVLNIPQKELADLLF